MTKVPTIEDLKALQRERGLLEMHVVWIGPSHFVLAHTDEERASIDLEECDLHLWLADLSGAPKDVGYYVAHLHQADAYSEPYGAPRWDLDPLFEEGAGRPLTRSEGPGSGYREGER